MLAGMPLRCGVKITHKPWGFEREIVNEEYCGKELHVLYGHCLSLHYHRLKTETFLVRDGEPEILYVNPTHHYSWACKAGEEWWIPYDAMSAEEQESYRAGFRAKASADRVRLVPGDIFHVPRGLIHSVEACGGDVVIIEFSTHHEDSDSYRLFDGN